jgi:hypothetical protein
VLTLLFWVCILGVVAYIITQIPMPSPFRAVAYGILVIMLLIILFQQIGGAPLSLR